MTSRSWRYAGITEDERLEIRGEVAGKKGLKTGHYEKREGRSGAAPYKGKARTDKAGPTEYETTD